MRVVWSYKDLGINFDKPFRWWLMVASAYSFKLFAPNFTRVFYVNQSIKDYLDSIVIDLSLLWDEVNVVDFDSILEKQGNSYWCNPKSYVSTIQSEPFAVVDCDIILTRPILDWLDPTKNYIHFTGNMLNKCDLCTEGPSTAFADIYALISKAEPGYRLLAEPSKGVNGGFVYYADPAIGALVGFLMLSIQSRILTQIDKFKSKLYPDLEELWGWIPGTILEEGLYRGIFDKINVPLENAKQGEDYIHQFSKNGLSFDEHEIDLYTICSKLGTDLKNYFKPESDYIRWKNL